MAYFLNYCDRQVVYAIYPVLKSELGFTNTQLGLTGSIFLWTTGLSSPLAGKLSDRYSRQALVLWTLLLWSAVTFLTGLSTSPGMLLAGRALLGLTEAMFIPVAVSLIGSTVPGELRSRAVSVFFTAQLCGVVAGGSLGGCVAERFGWRLAFFGLGIAGVGFAAPLAVFLRRFPEPPTQARDGAYRSSFLDLARIPSFISLCVCFPAFLLLVTILYAWLANFLHEKFSLGLASAAFTATAYLQSGTALGLLGGSALSDRLYRARKQARFWWLAAAMVFGSPWVHLLGHTESLTLAKVAAVGFGLANGVYVANLMVAPFDIVPARARTSAIAVLNTIAPLFAGLATLFAGVWKDRLGIGNLMSLIAAVTLLSGLILLLMARRLFEADYERLRTASKPQPNPIL